MSSTPLERLRQRIRLESPISFADFMEEALYGEGGYYTRDELPIGEDGDFVTGSSHSPLFGRTTAELLARLDREFGRPADYLEAGYGTGSHLLAAFHERKVQRAGLVERPQLSAAKAPVPDQFALTQQVDELRERHVEFRHGLPFGGS